MIENQWLEIALYPGCIQGFFLSYLLWRKKEANSQAIRYFMALLLTISILMLLRVTYQPAFFKQFAEIILLPDVILFLTGPFIYLFTRSLLRLAPLPPKRLYPHFIPATIHVFVVNSFLGLHIKGILHYLTIRQVFMGFNGIELASMVSFGIYTAVSLHLYYRYRAEFYDKYAAPLVGRFLRTFFMVCFVLLGFWLAGFLFKVIKGHHDYNVYTLFWVMVVASIYFLAYKIWSTPAVLELPSVLNEEEEDPTTTDPIPEATIQSLLDYMEDEKSFLNPEIKIGDLAEALDITKHYLSRVINQGCNKNFFDFINGYRVQEFIQLRKNERFKHMNTLELAYQSGFNSKSAFNRAFLKETGHNPRTYFATAPAPQSINSIS